MTSGGMPCGGAGVKSRVTSWFMATRWCWHVCTRVRVSLDKAAAFQWKLCKEREIWCVLKYGPGVLTLRCVRAHRLPLEAKARGRTKLGVSCPAHMIVRKFAPRVVMHAV